MVFQKFFQQLTRSSLIMTLQWPWFLILRKSFNYTRVNMMFESSKKKSNASHVSLSVISTHVWHILHTCKCIWIRLSVFPNCTSLLEIRVRCPRFPVRGACLPVEGNVGCKINKEKINRTLLISIQVRNNNFSRHYRMPLRHPNIVNPAKVPIATMFTNHNSITL